MDAEPAVSVIIPVRNASATIERQLDAVRRQSLPEPFEVVVVDNGSTDGTADLVRALAHGEPTVRLVQGPIEPNRSAARNAGVRSAAGALLAFCDADDVVQPEWLRSLCDALRVDQVVTGSLVRLSEDQLEDAGAGVVSVTNYRGLRCVGANNFAIRRSTFENVGGFSEDFKHRVDIELSCRLLVRDITIAYEPEAVVHYTRRTSRRKEARQHFWWAVADARILGQYRHVLPLTYSWRNSVKHWLLIGPTFLRTIAAREDVTRPLVTAAELLGRLYGSLRYRTWAI